jgi:protein SCO1
MRSHASWASRMVELVPGRRVVSGAMLALALVMSGGCRDAPPPLALAHGAALQTPREIAEFSLESATQQALTRASFAGRWTLLSIGFTHCPDVCPQVLTQLDAVVSRLPESGMAPQVVFVSVDPQRDSVRHLNEYVGYFNPAFIGATGSKGDLDRLCESLGFAYLQVPDHAGRYSVDHSTAVALIDPQARVVGYFTQPIKIQAMVDDLRALPPPSG